MEIHENAEKIHVEDRRIASNFLGILNDLKRRPEDASRELGVPVNEIRDIISAKKKLSTDIVKQAIKVWPINERDFYIIQNDCSTGVKIMTSENSRKSSRTMERANKPYYEYRDTAMSALAPFRPEWIMELCYVDDNDPKNSKVQWNNGHFMHQFTYFIGDVNFYYINSDGEKQVAIMKTGDSMYITPFTPHIFTTREGAKENGLILAVTFGNKLTGDVKQELSAISSELGQEFALDFSSRLKTFGSILKFHREMTNLTIKELSIRTEIPTEQIIKFETGSLEPTESELRKLSFQLNVNYRDLIPNDKIENKTVIKLHDEGRKWAYPENNSHYEFHELASSTALPYTKAFEINILSSTENNYFDLKVGLHQYVYNIGSEDIKLNWIFNEQKHSQIIHPGDSLYIKPFLQHNFRGKSGKILVVRLGGKIVGDPQRELSIIGKENVKRAIDESLQWYNPKGKN